MPRLTFEADGSVDSFGDGDFLRQIRLKKTGRIAPSAPQVIAPEKCGDGLRITSEFAGQIFEKQFD